MKKSQSSGFLLLDFAVSFIILTLILAAYLQAQEKTITDSRELAANHSTLRKVSGAAAYLAQYALAGEKGTYYETHKISEEKMRTLPQIKKELTEKLGLDSLEIYLGRKPLLPYTSKNQFCVTRLVIYQQAPSALIICGD